MSRISSSRRGEVKDRFPGPQPISNRTSSIFPYYRKKRNMLYVKRLMVNDHMMVATTCTKGRNEMCVRQQKLSKCFQFQLHCKSSVFDGTILDGELYGDTFLVYDTVMIEGTVVGHLDLMKRLDAARGVMKSIIYMKSDKFRLKCKTFHEMRDFGKFMDEYLPTVQQKVDGLVFTPVNEPIRLGTHETMFKWKPQEQNTVDFLMKWEPSRETPGFKPGRPTWRLYVQEKGKLYLEGEIPPDKADDIPILENGAILECMYMERDTPMWWKPLLKREDKDYPNNRRTFYRTLVNITEDIKMTDFLRCI